VIRFPANRDTLAAITRDAALVEAHLANAGRIELLVRTHTEERDGYPSGGSADGGSRPTDSTSSVERTALARVALGVDSSTAHLAQAVHDLHVAAEALRSMSSHLRAYRLPAALPGAQRAHIDSCLRCGRQVMGTPQDRLRRGLCTADYSAWQRAGCPDVATWRREEVVAG